MGTRLVGVERESISMSIGEFLLSEVAYRRVSGADHLFVNFNPENITDEAGKPANIYSPVGFSGGALVDLGDFTDPTAYSTGSMWRPALSGMLIEHRTKYK
jgi:hypothetical protein